MRRRRSKESPRRWGFRRAKLIESCRGPGDLCDDLSRQRQFEMLGEVEGWRDGLGAVWVGFPLLSANTTSRGGCFRGCRHFFMFRPPSLLVSQVVPAAQRAAG